MKMGEWRGGRGWMAVKQGQMSVIKQSELVGVWLKYGVAISTINLNYRNRMNLMLQLGSQNCRFAMDHPLLPPPALPYSALAQRLAHCAWPLHSPNFYVQLENLLHLWQRQLLEKIEELGVVGVQEWENTTNFEQLHKVLRMGLKIMKKMQFYRIGFNNQKLFYSNHGLLRLYVVADLKSVTLLTELEKYSPKEELDLPPGALKTVQQQAIYRDVSLKIAKHVLTQFKAEMYVPSRQLATKLFKIYGFTYDFGLPFSQNYGKALHQKEVLPSENSREALIIFFTFKILSSFCEDQQLCDYLTYLKNVLLDRTSGVLTASYELWAVLYETSLRVYGRQSACREEGWLEIDQILSSQIHDAQFQGFLLKHAQQKQVSLSSINFYLKNSKKQQRNELKPIIQAKIAAFTTRQFWNNVEDILQFVQNQLDLPQRQTHIQIIIDKTLTILQTPEPEQYFYQLEYGLAYTLQAITKYLTSFQTLLPPPTLLRIQNMLQSGVESGDQFCMVGLAFKYFDCLLSNVYSETDYSQWNTPQLLKYLQIAECFYKKGFVPSKSTLKLIYNRLSQIQAQPQVWERLLALIAQHYFCGGYEENSDLQLIQSHQIYSQVIASKILKYFQRLVSTQQIQTQGLTALLNQEKDSELKRSYFGVRGARDQVVFMGIQNISLVFSSQLSMQTLEFSLNYCTPFMSIPAWHPEEEGFSLLSLICEEMPIEVLKFAYHQLCSSDVFASWQGLEKIPVSVWRVFWGKSPSEVCFSSELQSEQVSVLQQLRRFQFVIDISNCVFDKLNEQSQKNIKQIKLIYEGGAQIAEQLIAKLSSSLLAVTCHTLLDKAKTMCSEQLAELSLADDQESVMAYSYVGGNCLLKGVDMFNEMGRVTQSDKVSGLEKAILPAFPHIPCEQQSQDHLLIFKYVQLISTVESTWKGKLGDFKAVLISKDWAKHMTLLLQSLKERVETSAKEKGKQKKEQEGLRVLQEKISAHVKMLVSKLVLPCALSQLLAAEDRSNSKTMLALMRAAISMLNSVDANYEQHFILQVETLQQILKQPSKSSAVPAAQILWLLQLFVDVIFSGVRIRSYHLYRIIKHYQRMTGQHPSLFNAVVANYIKVLFEEFITNYKPTAQLAHLTTPRKNLSTNHLKLLRHEVKFPTVESACTLSMFINLFCRLNHGSLAAGVERLFAEEDAKVMYLDYLTALTRIIAHENISISQKDVQILKVDVYGNLNIVAKGKLSQRLINKLVSLAKNLLRVKTDISGIDQLPLKLLSQKLQQEMLPLNLQDFQDECKALSLGALSLHRRLAPLIQSNLHYCNLFYLSGRNFEQNIEINKKLLVGSRQDIQNEVRRIGKEGVGGLKVHFEKGTCEMIDSLITKIQNYHQLCTKQIEYAEKLYASFKILCINCLNTPEIMPYVLSKSITVDGVSLGFMQFVVETLKICLPLCCQFVAVIVKTNWDFVSVQKEEPTPINFLLQLKLKQHLIQLFEAEAKMKERTYRFLPRALHFMQRFIPQNRFKYYRFAHFHKDNYQSLMKQANKQFNLQLLQACQNAISQGRTLEADFRPIFQIFATGLQNCIANDPTIDFKKLQTEQTLTRQFIGDWKKFSEKHQAIGSFKKINSTQNRQSSTNFKLLQQSKGNAVLQQMSCKASKIQFGKKIGNEEKASKVIKRINAPRIDEDLIGFSQSKFLISHSEPSTLQPLNNAVIQQFRLFNQELQSKEFMKGVTAFPTQEGISLIMNSQHSPFRQTNAQIDQNYLTSNQQDAIVDSNNSSDGIVESLKDFEQPSCEELIKFSSKAIEESQNIEPGLTTIAAFQQRISHPGSPMLNSDNIIYSEMQINQQEDGSMKLFGQEQSVKDLRSVHDAVSKDDILSLIEDYTLNPEAIKQIALKIKYIPTQDLQRLQAQQSREILFVIEAELRTRSIFPSRKEKSQTYDNLFIDEAKLFQKVRSRGRNDQKQLKIPVISSKFATQWLLDLLKKGAEGKPAELKQLNSFIRMLFLQQMNTKLVFSAALQILTATEDQFQGQFQITYTPDRTPAHYKQLLIDILFSPLVDQRIGLPILFFGYWSEKSGRLTNQSSDQGSRKRVIQILLLQIIRSPQKESLFLTKLLQYITALNQTTKFSYPYSQIQDAISIPLAIIQELSSKLRQRRQSFSDNEKLLSLFKVLTYLELKCLQEFLRIELDKTAEEVRRVCEREEQTLQQFQRQYTGAQYIEIDRKAEIYWNLRKPKHLCQIHSDIVLSRRILSDTITKVLPSIKANTFAFYYRQEDSEMKQELGYLERKSWEARHYWQRFELEQELQQRKKCYETWKRSNINAIVKQEIGPAFDEVSTQFKLQLRKSTSLLAELYELFGETKDKHPLLFASCCQFYLLMLAFQTAKRQDEQSHYSLSLLKTLPSIQSTRQAPTTKRRTSLNAKSTSIFHQNTSDFEPSLKRFATFLPKSILQLNTRDPLKVLHAKYADTQTKLRLLKEENCLGEKVIEVSRDSIWQDTYPHLDESFGKHDIKIKIKGELGVDYGGVTREWAALVVKEITNPNLGLFQLNANQLSLQPSKLSYLVPNHLEIFHRLGVFIGKALKEGWLLEVNFTKSFLKHILGATLYVEDLDDIDPYTAKGLMWILQNDVGDDLGFNFTFEEQMLQQRKVVDLVAGGSEIPVNNSNKKQYVKKLAYLKMTENIREQSVAFMEGLQKVIPVHLLKLLTYKEIGKFLAGHSVIDVKEMRKYAKYEGCSDEDQTVQWFWDCLSQKSEHQISEFLFFVSGSYKVPYSGFERHPITINKLSCSKDYCPVAHTCFSIIDLPEYSSKQKLNQMLIHAIKQGRGFTVS